MKKCLVLGGGFAGLTSAVYLSKAGYKVELIEASPKLGGRAYSFKDEETGTEIDNGQHILMGCYKETLTFFEIINSLDKLDFQENLSINFIKENYKLFQLRASRLPYPLSLFSALFNYRAISISERILMLKLFLKLPFVSGKSLEKQTVLEWLESENQNENIRKTFWDFLSISALNTSPDKASAKVFLDVLKEVFLHGNKSASIILPKAGLTETYCTNSQNYIEDRDGIIHLSEKAEEIKIERNKIVKVKTGDREICGFDYVISALPLYALNKIVSTDEYFYKPVLEYSSILTIHFWLKNNKIESTFYGLIGSPVHWLFNHGSHLTIVISDADDFMGLSGEELFTSTLKELNKYFGIKSEEITNYKVIKEKRATFIPSTKLLDKRPSSGTEIKNFFLAGDWIETGLPSTIESAVKSGRMAADNILQL
jgi:squalene-associated FAD-dependent desaturase